MKRVFVLFVIFALLLCTACSADAPQTTEPIVTTEATEPTKPGAELFTDELKAKLDGILEQNKYEGIVSLTCDGEIVYQWVKGTNDLGEPLTVESPMFIASTSKQFCAAAILMLREQGKLSLEDPVTKYFPEYTIGEGITLHHLLSMQSGIPRDPLPLMENPELYTDNSREENLAAMCQWTFEQPLKFTPGTTMDYSNLNYNLLSMIVEQVSGQVYNDFIRQNIYEPLGMNHSGFLGEVRDNPDWAKGLTYDKLMEEASLPGNCQGCGDVVTTAGDMELWMTGLRSGKVVSEESYQEMTTTHTVGYGYGLTPFLRGGWGHGGNLYAYSSVDYINGEYGLNLYMVNNNTSLYRGDITEKTMSALLKTVFEAADAAEG
jgi:CubicO group peptidase (beta-lactamase class C family)